MPKSVLSRGRKFVARLTALAMVASLMVIGAAPAQAAIDTSASCPSTTASAGFTDIGGFDATTQTAINCLVAYEISQGTSATTFSPAGEVSRWQMALFLTRQAEVHGLTLPDGSSQGFTDITGFDASTQIAINQLAQLDITQGTSATTFSPNDIVTRWQMALFLTRLAEAAGLTLPSGVDQGFADIAGLDVATQTAINQAHQLGIADGTSATTYNPLASTLRWQMALFLTRTLAADGIVPPAASVNTGAPQLVSAVENNQDDDVLEFVFDENVPGQSLALDQWRLYAPDGSYTNPTDAAISGNRVLARFTSTDISTASRATVRYGAVEDAGGIPNVEGNASLQPDAITTPDFPAQLIRVDNYRLSANLFGGVQRILIDFTFDDEDAETIHNLPAAGTDITATDDFTLIGAAGQVYEPLEVASITTDATADTTTVTIAMEASNPTEIPQSQLRRGIALVNPGANTQTLANNFASANGNTVDPDLVSVERTSATSYRFTFDEAVDDGTLDNTDFFVADAAGTNTAATSVARSAVAADGAAVVIATLPALAESGATTPVIGFVAPGAVTATDSTASINAGQNLTDEEVLTLPAPEQLDAGVTDLPDLVTVDVTQDVVTGNYSVTYTFDSAVDGVTVSVDFDLYDGDGIQFRDAGIPNTFDLSNSNRSVTLDTTNSGLTNEQMAAAVVGAVQETANVAGPATAEVTEGEVSVE